MVSGTVARVCGDLLVATYSTVAAKHRLGPGCACWRSAGARAGVLGRGDRSARPGAPGDATVPASRPWSATPGREPTALAQLAILVDLYHRGMREPLPLYSDARLRMRPPPPAVTDPTRRRRDGRGRWTTPGRTATPSTSSCRGRDPVGGAARGAPAATRTGTGTRRAGSVATRAGCGTACSRARR